VQAVTQQLPQWNGTEQDAPVLPLTMPRNTLILYAAVCVGAIAPVDNR